MRKILLAAVAATAFAAAVPALAANDNQSRPSGGSDIGPLGQCFSPPDCGGRGPGSYASTHGCSMVRERVVLDNGHVIFRRHRVCS
jgi:hypothetical protein